MTFLMRAILPYPGPNPLLCFKAFAFSWILVEKMLSISFLKEKKSRMIWTCSAVTILWAVEVLSEASLKAFVCGHCVWVCALSLLLLLSYQISPNIFDLWNWNQCFGTWCLISRHNFRVCLYDTGARLDCLLSFTAVIRAVFGFT